MERAKVRCLACCTAGGGAAVCVNYAAHANAAEALVAEIASAGGQAIAAAADVADSAAVEAMVARTDAACQIVEPPISPNGWCRYFYPQPVVRYRRRAAAGPAY